MTQANKPQPQSIPELYHCISLELNIQCWCTNS